MKIHINVIYKNVIINVCFVINNVYLINIFMKIEFKINKKVDYFIKIKNLIIIYVVINIFAKNIVNMKVNVKLYMI